MLLVLVLVKISSLLSEFLSFYFFIILCINALNSFLVTSLLYSISVFGFVIRHREKLPFRKRRRRRRNKKNVDGKTQRWSCCCNALNKHAFHLSLFRSFVLSTTAIDLKYIVNKINTHISTTNIDVIQMLEH